MKMNFLNILVAITFLYFAYRRMARYLHIYQQDEYDTRRFLNWIVRSGAVDKRLSVVLVLIAAVSLIQPSTLHWLPLFISATFLFFGFWETDPRRSAKKVLVMTKRASLIFGLSLGLVGLGAICVSYWVPVWGWPVAVQLIPLSLGAANLFLKPVENRTQQRYLAEARSRLAQINPNVIGITGSFGKTSAKHILGHILSLNTLAFVTPGSVNTPMGITRTVRESLPEDTRYFVVEMGAYGPGSIERLCQLTPPSMGIITSIGAAHYERFKSLDTVAKAKFELAASVLSRPSGRMLVHSSVLEQEYARKFVQQRRDGFIICGNGVDADIRVVQANQTPHGLSIEVERLGKPYHIQIPLYGLQQVGNIVLAFAAAVELGVAPDKVVMSLRTVPQISHRLEVKHQKDGSIQIDDAYNSNPIGFAAGLDVMSRIRQDDGRKILVTPGLVELGNRHDEIHRELGTLAAHHADIVVVVKPERIKTFVQAFLESGTNADRLIRVESFADANMWMRANLRPKDVILLENDLPDLYERRLVL